MIAEIGQKGYYQKVKHNIKKYQQKQKCKDAIE